MIQTLIGNIIQIDETFRRYNNDTILSKRLFNGEITNSVKL